MPRRFANGNCRRLIVGVIGLLGLCAPAIASGTAGEEPKPDVPWSTPNFIKGCRSYIAMMEDDDTSVAVNFDSAFGAGLCHGVVEAAGAMIQKGIACPPADATTTVRVGKLISFFDRYRNPMMLERSTPTNIVIQGFIAAYPCEPASK